LDPQISLIEAHAARLILMIACAVVVAAESWAMARGHFHYWQTPPLGIALGFLYVLGRSGRH
jgi:hypothetical protein